MSPWVAPHRVIVVLLALGALSSESHGLDAATEDKAGVPEAVLVARSVVDLAGVCSGRIGLGYAINGITGRWQVTLTTAGDRWAVQRRDESSIAAPPAPMGDVLRALADTDSSGSVSLDEIGRLHRLLYFGYIQEHYRGPMGYDLEGLMVATGLEPASLAATQAEHSELVAQAAERALIWPRGR